MKRYMLCPIVGDGQSTETAYRPSASDIPDVAVASVIPVNPNTGTPIYGFCFCRVGRVDFGPVFNLSNSFAFPDYPLDGRMDAMNPDVRTAMNQSVAAFNLDGQGLHLTLNYADADSYESVLLSIYQQFDPLLTEANFRRFDVAEAE